MAESVTQYTILISAPVDIIDEIQIVKTCFDKFNRSEGKRNKINLIPQYWKDDAYPEQGELAQNILNKQIVDDCDAVIAIFGTRFGMPTESYGSGTEEEISRLRNSKKQAFLYFSEKQVDPYSIDIKQFEEVKKYKIKVQNEGLYGSYKTLQEFEEKLYKHISTHFSKRPNLIEEESKHALLNCPIDLSNIFSNKFIMTTLYNVLGRDCHRFLEIMTKNFGLEYDEEEKVYSIKGAIPGLYSIANGIFEFKENGDIYIAFTNGENIEYYTNDEKYLQNIPKHKKMIEWFKSKKFEQLINFNSVSKNKLKAISGDYQCQMNLLDKAIMKIEVKEQNVEFKGHAQHGANVGKVEGRMLLIDGYLALYQDNEKNQLRFTFFDDTIKIEELGCFGGNNVTFQGEYVKI